MNFIELYSGDVPGSEEWNYSEVEELPRRRQ
jgi:hypothetical protein